jgi:hypothetical protein
MALTSGGLVKRSSSYDADDLRWLEERGKRLHQSVDWQIREAIREYRARKEAAEQQPERISA